MRLAVNLILANGRYVRAGDDIDESLVPANLRQVNAKYAAGTQRERDDADASEGEGVSPRPHAGKPKPATGQKYVRRGYAFRRIEEQEPLFPGEKLFKRVGNAFVRVGRVPKEAQTRV